MLLEASQTLRPSFSLRKYQADALDAIHAALQVEPNVLLQMVTGAGKTVAVCRMVNRYFFETDRRFLVLVHKQELVRQFQRTFRDMTDIPEQAVSISCASLNSKSIKKRITIATIQTFINQANNYPGCNLLIIDEVHRVGLGVASQYEQAIGLLRAKTPGMRLLGITATPYRLNHGYIYGDHATGPNLFDRLHYQVKYAELLGQGYLVPLEGQAAAGPGLSDELDNVRTGGGEYVLEALGQVMTREIHLDTARRAIDQHCQGFRCICIFCTTIDHAVKLQAIIGDECTTVHSQLTQIERGINMSAWKSGVKRMITSVNILVEGFDFPPLDCLVMVRPTLSTGLYVQAIGRVLRPAPGKDRAFLLDLTTNTATFGTDIDKVNVAVPKQVEDAIKKERDNEKLCPNCEAAVHVARMACPECGFEWPPDECRVAASVPKLDPVFFGKPEPVQKQVDRMKFFKHEKRGKPLPTLRVEYHRPGHYNSRIASEWVCVEHEGFAHKKAVEWWNRFMPGYDMPATVDEALEVVEAAFCPASIIIEPEGQYIRITDYIFDDIPF